MLKNINILSFQKRIICLFLSIGVAVICFAGESLGGGGGNKKVSLTSVFALSPLKTNTGFTLKAGPLYRGNSMFSEDKNQRMLTVNSVITYQKGNATYILPYKHKVSISAAKSSLQAVNVIIRR